MIVNILIGIGIALAVSWLILVIGLLIAKPKGSVLKEAIRILPDVLRLLGRIARDKCIPLRIRVTLFLLFAYIAFPLDPIPDFLPVIGYADEAILVVIVLRWIIRKTGIGTIERHWPGSGDGLEVLQRLAGLRG